MLISITTFSLNYVWPKIHFYVMETFFTLRPSDLNTTLNYVLMDNFCPCFYKKPRFPKKKYCCWKCNMSDFFKLTIEKFEAKKCNNEVSFFYFSLSSVLNKIWYILYTRKLLYEHFTPAFCLHNNLCEFTALENKF